MKSSRKTLVALAAIVTMLVPLSGSTKVNANPPQPSRPMPGPQTRQLPNYGPAAAFPVRPPGHDRRRWRQWRRPLRERRHPSR